MLNKKLKGNIHYFKGKKKKFISQKNFWLKFIIKRKRVKSEIKI